MPCLGKGVVLMLCKFVIWPSPATSIEIVRLEGTSTSVVLIFALQEDDIILDSRLSYP